MKESREDISQWIEDFFFPKLEYRSVEKDLDISKNVNSEICTECGGQCCKRCGCHFSPDDFKEINFDFLKKEIEKGYISIDYVDGEMIYQNIGVYILRVRNQCAPVVDFSFGQRPCILLTEKGCKLDYEHRPSGGKLLIPSNEFYGLFESKRMCASKYSIKDCCYEWKPHQKILYNLAKYFEDKEIPCSL